MSRRWTSTVSEAGRAQRSVAVVLCMNMMVWSHCEGLPWVAVIPPEQFNQAEHGNRRELCAPT